MYVLFLKFKSFYDLNNFLQTLLDDHPELKAFLNPSDLRDDDKMNVEGAKRFFKSEILYKLKDPGLKFYLTLIKEFYEGFFDLDSTVEERIIKVWWIIGLVYWDLCS